MLTNLNLTDVWTCYKALRRDVVQTIDLREERFEFEPEVTAKIAKGNGEFMKCLSHTRAGRIRKERKCIKRMASRRSVCRPI